MNRLITLLTDFGWDDEYVAVMKGVILSINPAATIVDITHSIQPQNVIQASWMLASVYPYFSAGTIHVIIVDPGVGTDRLVLAAKSDHQIFLAPDNGVLTPILEKEPASLIAVDNSDYFLHPVSQTFHGRDIFSPVAAHLSKGIDMASLGKKMDLNAPKRLQIPKPYIAGTGQLNGKIIHVDRFGNLITNIDIHTLKIFLKTSDPKDITVRVGNQTVKGLSESYDSVDLKLPLAVIGSRNFLEIAVNGDHAAKYFNVSMGEPITITSLERSLS